MITDTAAALYKIDAEFRQLIACWVQDRQPPLCLPDYLMEKNLPLQAECVGWCLEQPVRKWWDGDVARHERLDATVYPCRYSDGTFGWSTFNPHTDADVLPDAVIGYMEDNNIGLESLASVETALLALLDYWAGQLQQHPHSLPRYYQVCDGRTK